MSVWLSSSFLLSVSVSLFVFPVTFHLHSVSLHLSEYFSSLPLSTFHLPPSPRPFLSPLLFNSRLCLSLDLASHHSTSSCQCISVLFFFFFLCLSIHLSPSSLVSPLRSFLLLRSPVRLCQSVHSIRQHLPSSILSFRVKLLSSSLCQSVHFHQPTPSLVYPVF